MRYRGRSFTEATQLNNERSLSYPRVPLRNDRTLASDNAEGDAATTTTTTTTDIVARSSSLDARNFGRPGLPSAEQYGADTTETPANHDDSSDDSGTDEVIVRIDSPSRLSFRQA